MQRLASEWGTSATAKLLVAGVLLLGGAIGDRIWTARQTPTAPPILRESTRMIADLGKHRDQVLYLLATETCAACRVDSVAGMVRSIADSSRRIALRSGASFAFVGVSLDATQPRAMRLLTRLGPFDEIAIGRSWLNGHILDLLARDPTSPLVVPQLVLVEREIQIDSSSIRPTDARIVARLVGVDEIASGAKNPAWMHARVVK